jgi:predicted ATPase
MGQPLLAFFVSAKRHISAAIGILRGQNSRGIGARDLLAPVYGRFTDGFDRFDLKQAKALLDELAA